MPSAIFSASAAKSAPVLMVGISPMLILPNRFTRVPPCGRIPLLDAEEDSILDSFIVVSDIMM